jgi:hypothetical protein
MLSVSPFLVIDDNTTLSVFEFEMSKVFYTLGLYNYMIIRTKNEAFLYKPSSLYILRGYEISVSIEIRDHLIRI